MPKRGFFVTNHIALTSLWLRSQSKVGVISTRHLLLSRGLTRCKPMVIFAAQYRVGRYVIACFPKPYKQTVSKLTSDGSWSSGSYQAMHFKRVRDFEICSSTYPKERFMDTPMN